MEIKIKKQSLKEKCRHFEMCEAPLCPFEPCGIWYADEDICRLRKHQTKRWIQKQKKIAKLGLSIDDGFFSVEMLEAVGRVSKGISGADPDVWGSDTKWIASLQKKKNAIGKVKNEVQKTNAKVKKISNSRTRNGGNKKTSVRGHRKNENRKGRKGKTVSKNKIS